jgi:hypothetical protein
MSDRQAWHGQPYLDELRPDPVATVRLALFATYSVDVSAVAATLLALIGRNDDKGSGTAVDLAQAIDGLRDRVRILIQRGRIARPVALPKIAGILDQFIIEQPHDEQHRSWHPKIALVAYDGPVGRVSWKLWIGSRNLTRARDLDAGVVIEGSPKRGKGKVRIPGLGAVGARLAKDAQRTDAESIGEELESLWWEAPPGYAIRSILNGLEEGVGLPSAPPEGSMEGVTIISPFLSADFLARASKWGPDGSRTLISSMPALVEMANRASAPLKGFSKILAYAAPEIAPDDPVNGSEVDDDDAEPVPLSLHAKIYSFDMPDGHVFRVGSANATERAWFGRNSEIMLELAGGEAYRRGLDFLVRSASPVNVEDLAATQPADTSVMDALEESRCRLAATWNPILLREGDRFTLKAEGVPQFAYLEHRLEVGLAGGEMICWPEGAQTVALGTVPLSYQSAFIQVRIAGPDDALNWIQRVEVRPELEPGRDLAALARHMGLRAFHDWMRATLNGETLTGDGAAWDDDLGIASKQRGNRAYDRLTLEDILSAWARDRAAFGRADRHFMPYVAAILAHGESLSEAEKADLAELSQIWTMAREMLAS